MKPCAASCAMVTAWRVTPQTAGTHTSATARMAVRATTEPGGAGWVVSARCQTSLKMSTATVLRPACGSRRLQRSP